jgi:hypothetical protein
MEKLELIKKTVMVLVDVARKGKQSSGSSNGNTNNNKMMK